MGKTSRNLSLILTSMVFVCKFLWAFDFQNDGCGIQYVRGGRIVNGTAAYRGQYPWIVSIQLFNKHYCGGTLISDTYILSAAHCYDGIDFGIPFEVAIGKYYGQKADELEERIPVVRIIQHPEYRFPLFKNDIAIVQLAEPVCWNPYKQPICLPEKHEDLVGSMGTVAGWGWTVEPNKGGKPASVLQQVQLPILKNSVCKRWYADAGKELQLNYTQFCAGYEQGQKDSCQGDSGGPMMIRDSKRGHFKLIGIVSAGIGCAQPKLPGVYTNVFLYLPWIRKMTGIGSPLPKVKAHPSEKKTL